MSTDPVVWVSSILTIIGFSYLFKENEFYKAVEHLYVGVAAGYTVVMGYTNVVNKVWTPLTKNSRITVLIPAVLGFLLFMPYINKSLSWLRRVPVAVIVAIGAALSLRTALVEQFVNQIKPGIISLAGRTPMITLNNIIITLGTAVTLCYFIFTIKPNSVMKAGVESGKWVIMVTLGAAFGSGIMGRISLLIGELFLVFQQWIPLIKKV